MVFILWVEREFASKHMYTAKLSCHQGHMRSECSEPCRHGTRAQYPPREHAARITVGRQTRAAASVTFVPFSRMNPGYARTPLGRCALYLPQSTPATERIDHAHRLWCAELFAQRLPTPSNPALRARAWWGSKRNSNPRTTGGRRGGGGGGAAAVGRRAPGGGAWATRAAAASRRAGGGPRGPRGHRGPDKTHMPLPRATESSKEPPREHRSL